MARLALALIASLALAAPALAAPAAAALPAGASPAPSALASPAGAAPRWSEIDPAGRSPSARSDHALVAPSARAVYLFGGRSGSRVLADLWRLDLRRSRWTRLEPAGAAPLARFGHNLVADRDGTLLLFGGQSGGSFFDDAWRYDPDANMWAQLPASGPAARYGAGGAFDRRGRTLYVTHGFTDNGRFDDTWGLAGGAFAEVSGLGTRPLERCLVQAAFHDGGLFLFGGQSDVRPFLADLWRLDVTSREWRELEPRRRPAARNLYAAARAGRHWLIHGGASAGGPLRDLWSLDLESNEFARLRPRGPGPSARASHAAAALDSRRIVVFGGESSRGELRDAWLLKLP